MQSQHPNPDIPRPVRSAAVLLAAGSGTRVGSAMNKVLMPVDGVPMLARSVCTVLEVRGVHRIVLVVRPAEREAVGEAVGPYLASHDLWVVDGGPQRHHSEWQALRTLAVEISDGEIDVVAIHDAARPLASESLWREVLDTAAEHGGAIPTFGLPRLSRRDGGLAARGLVGVQTPQAFRAAPLLEAYRRAEVDGFVGTDTAACWERYTDLEIRGVPSTPANLKVTFPDDVALAEALLRRLS